MVFYNQVIELTGLYVKITKEDRRDKMELLKDRYFQEPFTRALGQAINSETSHFKLDDFMSRVLAPEFIVLELKEKLRACAVIMGESFELEYLEALEVIKKIAPKFKDFDSMVFPEYVDVYGQQYFNESLEALAYLTKYGSSEFAIRSFTITDTNKVLVYLLELSNHDHDYVRRFASEACRPKLPWAISVKALKEKNNLIKILEILENLKEDTSLFVRKSVANNLNDISKIAPDLVLETAKRWIGHSDHTDWILKQGLRTLLKRGNKEALALWGLNDASGVSVSDLSLSPLEIQIGEIAYLTVSFDVAEKKKLRGAYNIYYLKKNGTHSKKTFSFFEKEFERGNYTIKKKISFKEMSTRKHYAGHHFIEMVINGEAKSRIDFQLNT